MRRKAAQNARTVEDAMVGRSVVKVIGQNKAPGVDVNRLGSDPSYNPVNFFKHAGKHGVNPLREVMLAGKDGPSLPEGSPTEKEKRKKSKKDKKDKKEKKDKKNKEKKVKKKGKLKPLVKKASKVSVGSGGSSRKGVAGKLSAKAKQKAKAAAAPVKVLSKTEEDYEPVNRWWEREDGAASGARGAKKWDSFEHHGLMFAPDYEPHGIPIKYDGKEVKLEIEAEEIATYWCSCMGTTYEHKEIFINNFWKTFTEHLPKDTHIKEFSKCDFTAIREWRDKERLERLNKSSEEKKAIAAEKNAKKAWYAHALLNGIRERAGAVGLEPPQLFRGRGEHPKQGLLKKRTLPESVIINIAPDACVPKLIGVPGHAWKDVVHENCVQWLASFDDGLLGETKYVGFAATSGVKGQPDLLKYDRARRLLQVVNKVRESYTKLQNDKNMANRQKATATYFIDRLALRVGGEKDTDEEADTVGCCSLRVEHLTLEKPNIIHFDFLGKDSIQYKNSVPVTDQVFKNIAQFMEKKKPEDDVFDKVKPEDINLYFKEFMEDLTAKVFRTYNASYTLQQELSKFDMAKKNSFTQDMLVKFYNDANREVAILCNHQKAESKTHEASMQKMQAAKETMEKNMRTLKKHMVALESGKQVSSDSKLPKDATSCRKRMAETKMRLEKHVHSMAVKEENKTVSLGTSKMNYMDPRITVAWCKQVDLAIERVFPRTVRTKFPWAMHFKSTYRFD
uniref:DNA topoisomerase I n=1 Tax=Zooxanthella nutricula TaxID=1333877 RepID=A0A7S2QFU8_9DINO